ncbi:calcium uniporter protein 2, mitochondrial-like [Iris pallida]|uniref:Calcium uniporter protein 2, mitochondrial-like n=1 Tax=Iris pallida TaxID=29817 RepID=A0AAX6H673_IRIPA|nr:calcium uniporter protein 2, mitochondrial-like [Iris pallida]KAJ6854317.1 calcium uniporter protein 2, mitochondrial-like [Iris pallida]
MAFLRGAFAHRFLNSAKAHFPLQTQSAHSSSLLRNLPSDLRIRPAFPDAVRPPNVERAEPEGPWWSRRRHGDDGREGRGLSVEELRKVLRAAEMEMTRSRLRATRRESLSYGEFLGLCNGPEIARSLEESGDVIALRNVVFLYPGQIAKAIERVLPRAGKEELPSTTMEEFAEMERRKAEIDKKAEALVKRELRFGLGFVTLQTLFFMRLTFWELSWDVMEPICFFATSSYFVASYAFFLRTSKEPSFESLFQRRFAAKQKRLMEERGFDLGRFQELRKVHSHVVL